MFNQIIRYSSNELYIYTKPDDELNTYAKPTFVTLPPYEKKAKYRKQQAVLTAYKMHER